MGCELCKLSHKTHAHYRGLFLWSEVRGLKQVLLAISRNCPNNNVKTPNDSQTKEDCDSNSPIFHFIIAKIIPPIPVSMTPLAAMMTFSNLLSLLHSISYLRVQTCSWLFSLASVSSMIRHFEPLQPQPVPPDKPQ